MVSSGVALVYPSRPSRFLLYRHGICQQGVFFRRGLFDRFGGFDQNLKLRADQDVFCRCLLKYKITTTVVPEILVHYIGEAVFRTANAPTRY
jgi:hypothetical protein